MEWIIAVVVLVGETIITSIVGLIIGTWWNKKQREKEELAKLREKERVNAENERCNKMQCAIHEEMGEMKKEFKQELKPISDDMELMKKTMQKDVRRSLRQDGKMYCDRGYASQQEKTEFDELYWAYHNLGKNGVVDRLHNDVMSLPDEPKGDK